MRNGCKSQERPRASKTSTRMQLTIEDGVLRKLDLSRDYFGVLKQNLTSLPESIGQLTSLTSLYLYDNKLTSLPESIGQLTSLTELNVRNNKLTSLPESLGQLTSLTYLDLSNNNLVGELPHWLVNLENLKLLNVGYNSGLYGALPAMTCVNVYIDGTDITRIGIRIKKTEDFWGVLFVLVHVFMGYMDLVTDILSIITFAQNGNLLLMGLNIAILAFNVLIDMFLTPGALGKLLVLLHLQQAIQAIETLRTTTQTPNFVRSKKLDAICRSIPSVVLQLYGLLAALNTFSSSDTRSLVLSIASGVAGCAMTLASMAPKSGNSLFSFSFVVHFFYYSSELTARLISMSLMFICLQGIGFAVLASDFLIRYGISFLLCDGTSLMGRIIASASFKKMDHYRFGENACSAKGFIAALLVFGSDAVDDPGFNPKLQVYSVLTFSVLLISLFLVNLLDTPVLRDLRSAHGGIVVQE